MTPCNFPLPLLLLWFRHVDLIAITTVWLLRPTAAPLSLFPPPVYRPRAVTLLDVCLELECIVSCLFNPLHCHFRLRLWGPVAQLHAPPPPSPCSCAVYTTPRRRHPRVGVCGCFLWLFVVCFVLYRLCIYTHYIRCLCSASKRLKERIRLEPFFLRRTNKEYERVSKTFCGSCYWYQKIFNHMTEHYENSLTCKTVALCGSQGCLCGSGCEMWVSL